MIQQNRNYSISRDFVDDYWATIGKRLPVAKKKKPNQVQVQCQPKKTPIDPITHTLKNNISLNYYIVKYSVTMLKYSIVHYI
jgi:hypothetical protein